MRTFLLILMLIGLISPGHAQEDSLSHLLREGIKLHDAGDYAGAIANYDAIIAAHPGYFDACYEKSFSLFQSGKYQECADISRRILQDFPDNASIKQVYVTYGSAMDGLRKPDEALKIYEEGIQKFPDFYLLPFNKGMTEYARKDYVAAIKDYETAIRLNRGHASSHQYLAYSIYSKNKMASAMGLAGFLLFEPTGTRAEKNLKLLVQILGANVEKKDEKTININLSAAALDSKGKEEDDFGPTELMVSMTGALNMTGKAKDTTDVGKLEGMLEILATAKPAKSGFFTETYVNLLAGVQKAGLLGTAAHVMYMSSRERANQQWLEDHEDKLKQLTNWMSGWVKQ